jgi:diadenosine tetraphosphatase ApaH/serine/threonine PP2A family protein phosphatase
MRILGAHFRVRMPATLLRLEICHAFLSGKTVPLYAEIHCKSKEDLDGPARLDCSHCGKRRQGADVPKDLLDIFGPVDRESDGLIIEFVLRTFRTRVGDALFCRLREESAFQSAAQKVESK